MARNIDIMKKVGCLILMLPPLLVVGFFVLGYLVFSSGSFIPIRHNTIYDKKDLTENYDKNEQKISELIDYFESIIPPDICVDIEIEDTDVIGIFHVRKHGKNYGGWNIDIDSPKADTIFQILKWNRDEIKTLKQKLDEVNCISLCNSKPFQIGFQRSLMSKFFYVVFDESIVHTDSLMQRYDDKCIYIHYRDNIVLEYGSGAIGSICFPPRFLE